MLDVGTINRLRGLALVASACVALPCPAQAPTSQLNGYVTVASDYVNRGLAPGDGHPSLQVGLDFQHPSGVFLGGRAASVYYVIPLPDASSTQIEAALYAGFSRRIGAWSLTSTVSRYAYRSDALDGDYTQLGASFGFRDRLFLTATYADDFFGSGTAALDRQIGGMVPLPAAFELGANLGRFESSGVEIDYTHWNIGVSRLVRHLGIDLRYYASSRGADRHYYPRKNASGVLRLLESAPAPGWVLSLSYGFRAH